MKSKIIQQRIFEIRGQKVMLDFDLAELYQVETRVFNQAIKRNIDSFPRDFMFRITAAEWSAISSQFVMTSYSRRPKKALPYAFNEHGVTMLASVLKSAKARKMNIAIVRAFVAVKKFSIQHKEILEKLEELKGRVGNHDSQLDQIYIAIEKLLSTKGEQTKWEQRQRIGFKK